MTDELTDQPIPIVGPAPECCVPAGSEPADGRFAVLLGVVAAPFVVAAIAVATRDWTPAGDQAIQLLRIGDVGTSRTPLVGAWSRWGWNHPGPWPTYVLAPFTWLFGNVGALIGTLALNMASLLLAVVMGRRRGGIAGAALVASAGLLVGFAQGPTVLMDPWNPFVGLFPLYALFVAVWSLSDRDWTMLPVAVALGSFSVQAHVGYLPVVVGIVVAGVALGLLAPLPDVSATSWRRPLAVAAGVAAIAWLPPLVEALGHRGGNVADLARYAVDSPEPAIGWSVASRIFATELGLPGAWVTGREFDLFGSSPSPVGAWIVVLAAAVLGAFALRAGARSAARLSVIAVVSVVASWIATARISGQLYDYLLVWWWAVGAAVWLSIGWSAWSLLDLRRPRVARMTTTVVVVAAATVAAGLVVRSLDADLPVARQSAAVSALIAQTERQLDEDDSYVVEWRDTYGFGYVGTGVFAALDDAGFDVVVPTTAGFAFEPRQRGDVADQRLVVSTRDDDTLYPPPEGSLLVARYDPLTPSERTEADTLWSTISAQAGTAAVAPGMVSSPLGRAALIDAGVGSDLVERFTDFWDRGQAFVVYLAPGTSDT
jgi:hypothetical protein